MRVRDGTIRLVVFMAGPILGILDSQSCQAQTQNREVTTFRIVLDRGADVGQCFGTLFEVASEDGAVVIGAGFPNVYNTQNRADRHQLQFFVRPTSGERKFEVESLPRPNQLCGTYLHGRDNVVYSTFGGLKAWDATNRKWREESGFGDAREVMRVGSGLLEFGESTVRYGGRTILEKPARGRYHAFFYANGTLCFYHVNPGNGGYRPFKDPLDGFSKLLACRWIPGNPAINPNEGATTHTLPIVGETTFAWGVLGNRIVTGSNIGGFYVLEDGRWRMLREPNLKVSYQLYSTIAFHDHLLMGHYPTGRLFNYDGKAITDRKGWPPVLAGVSGSAREAQTTVIYGGDLLVGVWPWGELWRYNADARKWYFMQRMFAHPELSDRITHPYDLENKEDPVGNLWGQRVSSLLTNGTDLYVSTSAKHPCQWNPDRYRFLAPEKWKSYGSVYRLTMPGHLAANLKWTGGQTILELAMSGREMTISQDGKRLAASTLTGPLAEQLRRSIKLKGATWKNGIFGPFIGKKLDGSIHTSRRP